MSNADKRKHTRYETLNLLHITVLEGTTVMHQGMGRTLNVSKSGILLETTFPLFANDEIELNIGFQDEILEIRGRAVHCKPGPQGSFETGVSFAALEDQDLQILMKYIDMFQATQTDN